MPIVQKASISKLVLNPKINYMFSNELEYTPETPMPPFKVKYSRKKFKENPIIQKIQTQTEEVDLGNVLGTQLAPFATVPSNPIVQTSVTPTPSIEPTSAPSIEPTFTPSIQPTLTPTLTAEAPATVLEPTPTSEPVGIPNSNRYVTMVVQYAFRLFADFARGAVDNFSEAITELAEALENTVEVTGGFVQSMQPYARLTYSQSIQLMRSAFAGLQNLVVHSQSLSGPLRDVGIALNEFIQTRSDNSREIIQAFIRRYLAQPIVASMSDELRTRIMSLVRELNQGRPPSAIILGQVRNILENIVELDEPSIPLIGSSESTGLVVQRPARNNINQAMNEIITGMQRLSLGDRENDRVLIDTLTIWFLSLLGTLTSFGLRRIGK